MVCYSCAQFVQSFKNIEYLLKSWNKSAVWRSGTWAQTFCNLLLQLALVDHETSSFLNLTILTKVKKILSFAYILLKRSSNIKMWILHSVNEKRLHPFDAPIVIGSSLACNKEGRLMILSVISPPIYLLLRRLVASILKMPFGSLFYVFFLAPTGALIVMMVCYLSGSGSNFFRFSLSPLMQLMLQVSL